MKKFLLLFFEKAEKHVFILKIILLNDKVQCFVNVIQICKFLISVGTLDSSEFTTY